MLQTTTDLSRQHQLISDLFEWPQNKQEWETYRLSEDQVNFFKEKGYLPNIKLLEDWQVDRLNEELAAITDPEHPGNALFYEFHSNESTNPDA
ncbi:MAG: phytanoyl-CoA dioxygenase family protein, partial [Cyclobacteriaceae bacterium]